MSLKLKVFLLWRECEICFKMGYYLWVYTKFDGIIWMEHFPSSKTKERLVDLQLPTRWPNITKPSMCYATRHPKAIVFNLYTTTANKTVDACTFEAGPTQANLFWVPKTMQVNVQDGKLWYFYESKIFHIMSICNIFIECAIIKRRSCKKPFLWLSVWWLQQMNWS